MTTVNPFRENIGTKFNADGSIRFFPGNTVLSFIDPKSEAYSAFCHVRSLLLNTGAAKCFVMLPDDSLHMTVFEGVCGQWRAKEIWPALLPLDAPLEQVDDLFEAKFAAVKKPEDVTMRLKAVRNGGGYAIALSPSCEKDLKALTDYRGRLSEAFGMRFPNHDAYRFHISICYGVHAPSPAQAAELAAFEAQANDYLNKCAAAFSLQEPVLTYFQNMFHFSPSRIPRT